MSLIFKKETLKNFKIIFKKISGEKCPTDSVSLVLENHFQTKLIPICDVENIILVIFCVHVKLKKSISFDKIFEQNYTFFRLCHGRTYRKSLFFFENSKLLGLGRQIGPENVGAFWAFLSKL